MTIFRGEFKQVKQINLNYRLGTKGAQSGDKLEQESENLFGEQNTQKNNNLNIDNGIELLLNEANWISTKNLININKPIIYNSTTEHVTKQQEEENTQSPSDELLQILIDWGKEVDGAGNMKSKINSITNTDEYLEQREKTITKNELFDNILKMTQSDNSEIAGIGEVIKYVFDALGMDLPEEGTNYNNLLSLITSKNSKDWRLLVANEIYNAIFNALYPEDNDNPIKSIKSEDLDGLNVEDLVKLDKNGDGSIVDELKALLNSPDFIKSCEYKINTAIMQANIAALDTDFDGKISQSELTKLKSEGYSNSILDLLFIQESNKLDALDTTLLFLLGAEYDEKSQEYVISQDDLYNALLKLDKNGDGKVTQEEVEQFRQENKACYESNKSKSTEITPKAKKSFLDDYEK